MFRTDVKPFADALCEALSEKYSEELSACGCDASCTPGHYKKMSAILGIRVGKTAHPVKKTVWALILAAALLLASCAAYVYRREIGGFFEKVYEDFITIESSGRHTNGSVKTGEWSVDVSYIPSGYTLVRQDNRGVSISQDYEDASGKTISLLLYSSGSISLFLNLGDEPASVVTVGNTDVYCHSSSIMYSYAWRTEGMAVILRTPYKLTPDELESIVTGVKVSKK